MKSMSVDVSRVARMVSELYPGPSLAVTELQRYWANVVELRDALLHEFWKESQQNDPSPRNEDLIDTVKACLKLPLAPTASSKQVRDPTAPHSSPSLPAVA